MSDPVRWLDDPDAMPEELRIGMEAYALSGPSPRELAEVRVGLRGASGPLTTLKWLALACTAGVTAWLVWPRYEEPRVERARPPVVAPVPAPTVEVAPAAPAVETPPPVLELPKKRRPRASVPLVVQPSPTSDPVAELALLRRARKALAVAPSTSLALTDEHARDFPQGAFAQERELIAIEALAHTERAAAIARARAFAAAYPESAHRARIEALLGDH